MRKVAKLLELHAYGRRFKFAAGDSLAEFGMAGEDEASLSRVLRWVARVAEVSHELAIGRYAHLASVLPEARMKRALLAVVLCTDGVLLRWQAGDAEGVVGALAHESVEALAPVLSEWVVYLVREGATEPDTSQAPVLRVGSSNRVTETRREIGELPCHVVSTIPADSSRGDDRVPRQLAAASSTLDIYMEGIEVSVDAAPGSRDGQRFLTRTTMRLPVGWERFQVLALPDDGTWDLATAPLWAENDLLREVATRNARRERLRCLDPRFDARAHYRAALRELDQTLESAEREEDLQRFLAANPSILDPSHARVWPKLALGAHVTDFVIRRGSGQYALVELEHPEKKLFTKAGQPTAQLTQAIDQTLDWERYLEDNLNTVRRELGLTGIGSSPEFLIVIGRAAELTDTHRRKLATLLKRSPSCRVITYDDLRQEAAQAFENVVGPLREQDGPTETYYLP